MLSLFKSRFFSTRVLDYEQTDSIQLIPDRQRSINNPATYKDRQEQRQANMYAYSRSWMWSSLNLGPKSTGSERSWVRKGLGPNRLIPLGPKGLGSETSDIR